MKKTLIILSAALLSGLVPAFIAFASGLDVQVSNSMVSSGSSQLAQVHAVITNSAGKTLNNVNVDVNFPSSASIVPNSIQVSGVPGNLNDLNQIFASTLASGQTIDFYFELLVSSTSNTKVTVSASSNDGSSGSQGITITPTNTSSKTQNAGSQSAPNCNIDYTNTSNVSTQLCNPLPQNNLDSFLTSIVKVILAATAGFAVIMIVTAGVRMVVSAGNQEAVAGAKSQITWSLVGLIIAILAYTIISVVINALQGKS
ncbi:hypothetical protein KGQ24_03005 [Patescibacteria group bacterium]|nr:hypothetical protein [Patescibacteria group bacterium]